tara:strand:- start:135 stop:1019 length:885 start_codon:yes stop_codon:yes gene_type:complete
MVILDFLRELKKIPIKISKRRIITRKNKLIKDSKIFDLLNDGFYIPESIIDLNIINHLIEKYNLYEKNFKKSYTNVHIPIIDKKFLDYIQNHKKINFIVNTFYSSVYNKTAILQTPPSIVITNPLIENNKDYQIPSKWHTDYKNEFTFHIPLIEINEESTKTLYLKNSQNNININPQSLINLESYDYRVVPLMAKKGSVIFIDVSGAHRAELGKFRIMVQFKFTTGNDLITEISKPDVYSLFSKKLKENFIPNSKIIKKITENDLNQIQELKLNKNWFIISKSTEYFNEFINNL